MKAKFIRSSIAATFLVGLMSATPALAENTTEVHFKGEIVESACGISPDSIDQTIQLGQYPTHIFKAQGDRSTPVPFRIKLIDCDTSVLKKANFIFTSNQDTTGKLFSVEGGATGLGVRILHDGVPIDNGAVAVSSTLVDGTNIATFSAAYEANVDVSTTPVTAGPAESWALLRVTYQ
ncbi:fimbrial protein [Vibrio campbellii]|uniref:fimbrial protein n=1 Tax=Vibrio campbellii TaxID=680 RepID=UPI000CF48397|nr:fimbrial protein [Vibrio campbellii]PQJ42495.1 fimbrial protein [Vibrio campbellii]